MNWTVKAFMSLSKTQGELDGTVLCVYTDCAICACNDDVVPFKKNEGTSKASNMTLTTQFKLGSASLRNMDPFKY